MNTPQNLPVAFPLFGTADLTGTANWAATAQKQTFRHSYCNSPELTALQVRYDRFIPMLAERTDLPTKIFLVEYDSPGYANAIPTECADITALLSFSAFTADGVDYIEYPGSSDINQATTFTAYKDKFPPGGLSRNWATYVVNKGFYFLILEFADTTRFYSELFQLVDFPEFSVIPDDECESRMRIECANTCPIGDIPAVIFAPQKLFIKNPTSTPTYITEKSVATNGQRQEKLTWGVVKKRWLVSFFAPETVADFCSLIPLYSANVAGVLITDTYGVSGPVKDVEVEISWPDELGGCLAKIDLYFTRDFTDFENCC